VTSYIVYPINPTQTVETSKTEAALKELPDVASVTPNQHNDNEQPHVIDSWSVTTKHSTDITAVLSALEGVHLVEHQEPFTDPAREPEHPDVVRRDEFQRYVAMAKNDTDTQKTEDFLKSKVQSGTEFYPFELKGRTVGWYGVMLNSGAKDEVQKYDGVKILKLDEKKVLFRALPAPGWSQNPPHTGRPLEQRSGLMSRDGTWVKQANADKALNMDSQFS